MREFFLIICPYAIWCIAAAEALFTILFLVQYTKSKDPMLLCMGLITVGLFLDAAIIGLGAVLKGDALAGISRIRFFSHGLLIPLLFPICAYALRWKKPLRIAVWCLTVLLMVAGVAQAAATVLEPKELAGVMRYAASGATPKWADTISRLLSFGTVIPLMIAGIAVWIRQKTPHLFLSGFLMFTFSALGPATGNTDLIFFISMFGEVLMVLFFRLYAMHAAKEQKN